MLQQKIRKFRKGERLPIYDDKGNLWGYTEYTGNGLYDHFNQDEEYLATTDSEVFEFEKYANAHEDNE